MRLGEKRGGGEVKYPTRAERDLTAECPAQPAAVMVYDDAARTRTLVLDFDAKHGRTPPEVQADYAAVTLLLDTCGVPWIADAAHGGIHVYALVISPIPLADARELIGAFAQRYVTLDPGPHYSAIAGCITAPGTAHKAGGQRELLHTLAEVQQVLSGPRADTRAVARLRTSLADEISAYQSGARAASGSTDEAELTIPDIQPGTRRMAAWIDQLARDGDFIAAGKPSASEARQSILNGAVAVGMEQSEVRALIVEGSWAGLGHLLAHKDANRLSTEYTEAQRWIAERDSQRSGASGKLGTSVHRSDTSTSVTHRGAARGTTSVRERSVVNLHRAVRTWRATLHQVEQHEFPGARGWKVRMVLRTLSAMAHANESLTLAVGTRNLGIGADLSHETVAYVLKELQADPDPWIVLAEHGEGADADLYELRVPDRHRETAERAHWVRGKAHGVRPLFSELGTPAALVFEAAEQGHAGTVEQIMLRTGLSKASVYGALQTLIGWHLVETDENGYQAVATDADLDRLARRLGAHSHRGARIKRYKEQRQKWHEWLADFEARQESYRAAFGPRFIAERELAETEPNPWDGDASGSSPGTKRAAA